MYGTIQLSEVLFNSHIGSLSKAKASMAGVGNQVSIRQLHRKDWTCIRNNSMSSTRW